MEVAAQVEKIGLTVHVAVPALRFQMNAKKVCLLRIVTVLNTKDVSVMP